MATVSSKDQKAISIPKTGSSLNVSHCSEDSKRISETMEHSQDDGLGHGESETVKSLRFEWTNRRKSRDRTRVIT